MSLAIVIGSEPEHLTNIEDTIELLRFTKNIVSNAALSIPDGNNIKVEIDSEKLNNIITWYTGIHTLLTDPSALPTITEQDEV